nr:MAG TPA: hypothetical protein [Caudoviricetes sp.]
MLVMRAQRLIPIRNQRWRVELKNRQLGNGAADRKLKRTRRKVGELQRDRAVETGIDEAGRDVHEQTSTRPRRLTFDTGNEMRGNAYQLRGPCQGELPGFEKHGVCDPVVRILSGQSDVADNVTMKVHLHTRRLNGSFFEWLNGQHSAIEEARDCSRRQHAHAGTFLPRSFGRGVVGLVRLRVES